MAEQGGQGAWRYPVAVSLGSLAALAPAAPLPVPILVCTGLLGAALLLPRRTRLLSAFLLAACWAHAHVLQRLDDRLPASASRQVFTLQGQIASVPRIRDTQVSFEFERESAPAGPELPRRWQLRWYRDFPAVSAGQRWELQVLATPPWGRVNFQGEDRERWLMARGIGALGSVRDGRLLAEPAGLRAWSPRWRQSVFSAIGEAVPGAGRGGIVQALATADRSQLGREQQDWMRRTGTSHLLAISGLHVGLAAAGSMLAARIALGLLPVPLGGLALPALVAATGLLTATAYAALAGFGLPTLRALLMLAAVIGASLLARVLAPLTALVLALAATLLIAPLAPLAAGFWLSFGAVTALILLAAPRPGGWSRIRALVGAQFAVMLFLLPAGGYWFGGFSGVAMVANLVAIPWVSLAVVPAVLVGVAAHSISAGSLAALAWQCAAASAELLMEVLRLGAHLQGELIPLRAPSLLTCVLASVGAALLLLPRGLPVRWSGAFLLLPLFAPTGPDAPLPTTLRIDFLDAGQGTALMLQQGGRTLLYDTGPGDGDAIHLVDSVIGPALRASGGAAPDLVVVSHGDLDHAGGLEALRQRYPQTPFLASLRSPPPGVAPCRAGHVLPWGDWRIETLHPGFALPYLGNDSSCVLRVAGAAGRVLLPGDVGATIEARLLTGAIGPHDVLLVPHHGSMTSSSEAFVRKLSPRVAVATAGPGNRFGFPRGPVRERYRDLGAAFWSTGECGAIRLDLAADGSLSATSARRRRTAVWRWPADPSCPLSVKLPRVP